jgi:hypothetical protein
MVAPISTFRPFPYAKVRSDGKTEFVRSEEDEADLRTRATSLNYCMVSLDAKNRELPFIPPHVDPIHSMPYFHHRLHQFLHLEYKAVSDSKLDPDAQVSSEVRELADKKYKANLQHLLDKLEEQYSTLSQSWTHTDRQAQLTSRGMKWIDDGMNVQIHTGEEIHTRAQDLIRKYISAVEKELNGGESTSKKWPIKKILIIALIATALALLIGLIIYLATRKSRKPQPQPQMYMMPPPGRPMQTQRSRRQPQPQPQQKMQPPPPINPALLGYNPGNPNYITINTPFNPSPLYSYPA